MMEIEEGPMSEHETRRDGRYPLVAISRAERDDALVLVPEGEIDLASAGALDAELRLAEQSHAVVVLDLSELTFMDSTGLHMLIEADQRMRDRGGRLVIIPGAAQIQRLLKLTGVADRLQTSNDASEVCRQA